MNIIKYCESDEILIESGFIISDEIEAKFSIFVQDDKEQTIGSFSFDFFNDKYNELDIYKRDVCDYAYEYQYINFDGNDKKYKNEGTEIIESVEEIMNINFHKKIDIVFRYKITGNISKPKTLHYIIYKRINNIHDEPKGLLRRIFG